MRWRDLWNRRAKWLGRTVLIGLGVLLAVPLVTNVALWLRVIPRLLNADSAALSYRFAWSPWPTRIRFEGMQIIGRDANVEFAVGVDEAWLTLDLWSAVSAQTINITRFRGVGTTVRVLQRLDPASSAIRSLKRCLIFSAF